MNKLLIAIIPLLILSGCVNHNQSVGNSSKKNSSIDVAAKANSFMAMLTDSQRKVVSLKYTKENAVNWSNLPCGSQCRNGIIFSKLNKAQISAAKDLIYTACGKASNAGYNKFIQILAADDVLGAAPAPKFGRPGPGGPPPGGKNGPPPGGKNHRPRQFKNGPPKGGPPFGGGSGPAYASGDYYIAFLGKPADTGTWQLQFGGHHLAVNITYKNGAISSATPLFMGIEPKTWKTKDTVYAPLTPEKTTMANLLSSLNEEQLNTARLKDVFSDVMLGPGMDGRFPVKKVGIAVNTLNLQQQQLVLNIIKSWTSNAETKTDEKLFGSYKVGLKGTYVAFSGDKTLTHHADYIRLDGPDVWIELVCQDGVVFPDQIHYHTIWRDHTNDYGGDFKF